MKTQKVLGTVERKAARQVTLLMRAARRQYDRFMHSADTTTDTAAQRRYIHAAEQTIVSAEKIIAQLKKRIVAAKRSLPGARKTKRKAKSTVKRAEKKTVTRKVATRKKRM